MIYQLSTYGRAVDWGTWKVLNGCGVPNSFQGMLITPDTKLGEIEDHDPATGRALARYAVERLEMPELGAVYCAES
jgi:hypothetical protein